MEAYDRAQGAGAGRGAGHSMEDMVEAIMERAYAEEIMEVRGNAILPGNH